MCIRDRQAQQYYEWVNDPAVTDGVGTTANVISLEGEQRWLAENSGDYQFAIVLQGQDRLIGNCGIKEIDWKRRCGEVGLFIGSEADRGKGYGKEVLRLLLGYCFETLNLHNVELHVFSFNARAIAAYKSVGFREAGRRREAYFLHGAWYDLSLIHILKYAQRGRAGCHRHARVLFCCKNSAASAQPHRRTGWMPAARHASPTKAEKKMCIRDSYSPAWRTLQAE